MRDAVEAHGWIGASRARKSLAVEAVAALAGSRVDVAERGAQVVLWPWCGGRMVPSLRPAFWAGWKPNSSISNQETTMRIEWGTAAPTNSRRCHGVTVIE